MMFYQLYYNKYFPLNTKSCTRLPNPDLVPGENADAVASENIPQPNGAIGWPRGNVIGVGVEAGAGDVG